MWNRLGLYSSFVKLEHTVFSVPLIVAGTILFTRQIPSWSLLALVLVAGAAARVIGMGLNRIVDVRIDAQNPRTQGRELASGKMSVREGWLVVGVAGIIYLASAAAIAPICVWLSPLPVLLFFIYPYLKRVTPLAHLGLGLAWSMAPLGGWLAASKSLSGLGQVTWLWLFSCLWVTGFDIIYATLDEDFDRRAGLHSMPARFGKRSALLAAAVLHVGAFLSLVMLWMTQLSGLPALMVLVALGSLFVWQHAVADRKPEFAFFKLNGALGFVVFGFIALGL